MAVIVGSASEQSGPLAVTIVDEETEQMPMWKELAPREIAGIRLPDTRLAIEATALVHEASSLSLFNHVLRTYVFAELFGRAGGARYDSEVLYIAAVMHDLGLTDSFQGAERFEVDGADAARQFLVRHRLPEEKTWLIWDAIALHTSVGIAHRKQPEVALLHFGAGADAIGLRLDELPPGSVRQLLQALPRLGFRSVLLSALEGIVRKKPHTAAFNFTADVARRCVAGYEPPDGYEWLTAAPFPE